MNSREMIGEFRALKQALSGWLDSATLSLLIAGISAQDHALRRSQNCAITVTHNLFSLSKLTSLTMCVY